MKKTINVNLGGLVFALEEDAYNRLSAYLESLKAHFKDISYGNEVISDIETRIAEDFTAKTHSLPNIAITLADVEAITKSIGSVEDFAEPKSSDQSSSGAPRSNTRKFYRNPDNAIIAGVASGLAAYFGIDTTLVRVIFVVIILAGGWGIPLYLLLWLLVPEAKSATEKLEMTGSPVTIKQIEQTAKQKINEVRNSGAGSKLANFIGQLIKLFVRIVLGIVGIVITFASAVAAFAVTFGLANLLFNRNSPYVDFPLAGIFNGGEYVLTLLLALVVVAIPLIFLAIAGVTLIRMKRPVLNGFLTTTLVIIWMLAAIASSVIWFNKAPALQSAIDAYRGNVETRNISLTDFQSIDASSAYKVNITSGKEYKLTATGHTRDLDLAKMSVDHGTLVLDQSSKVCFFCFESGVTVDITMPNLNSISGSGAVQYTIDNFAPSNFQVDLSGASKAGITNLKTSTVTAKLTGASHLTMTGTGTNLNAKLSGASRIESYGFTINDAVLDLSGASHAEVNATKTLSADASGASTVSYKGNPVVTKQDESGSSHIQPE